MNINELYDGLAEFYGVNNQIIIAVEELSELQKELCKALRGKKKLVAISEEMADVEIMLEQLKRIFQFLHRIQMQPLKILQLILVTVFAAIASMMISLLRIAKCCIGTLL